MACSYYKCNIAPCKYIWQAQPHFFSPHSLTAREVLWHPETRREDKEPWKNEPDLRFIHTSHQDQEEMELEKIHGMYLRDDWGEEVWSPLRRQGWRTGSCDVIGTETCVQVWGEKGLPHHGSGQMGDLGDGRGHSAGLIPYALLRKSSFFPKVAPAVAKWQWQCHCVLSTVFPVWSWKLPWFLSRFQT